MAPGLRSRIVWKEGSWGQAAVSTKETAISENAGPTRAVARPARLPEPVGRPWAPAYEASWHGFKLKRQCEPQRGGLLGYQLPQEETGCHCWRLGQGPSPTRPGMGSQESELLVKPMSGSRPARVPPPLSACLPRSGHFSPWPGP